MKNYLSAVIGLLLIIHLQIAANAYDFREDKMSETELAAARAASEDFHWEQARHVFRFHLEEFLDLLDAGLPEDRILSAPSVWEVRIDQNDTEYSYAVTGLSGKKGGHATVTVKLDEHGQEQYPFAELPVPPGIAEGGSSVYLVSVPEHTLYFIVVSNGSAPVLVPYASRPDFFELDNGTVYTLDEINTALSEYSQQVTQPAIAPAAVVVCAAVVLLACVLIWRKKHRIV